MPGEEAFQLEGVVVEVSPNGTWRIELKNGHRLLGFLTAKARSVAAQLTVGTRVTLRLSPYDLSQGRILGIAEDRES